MKRTSTTLILLTLAVATATLLAAERSTIQYKGMSVREPAPYGEAGLAWQNNFKALADRVGPCNFTATAPPTATDDSSSGYSTGSLWLDTAANRLYWCASAASAAAAWIEVSPADLSAVYQPLAANLTTWSGVASSADGRAIVSAADYAAMRGLLGLGTMATQGADAVAITGGAINGTAIGATTPKTGAFTRLYITPISEISTRLTGDQIYLQNHRTITGSWARPLLAFKNDADVEYWAIGAYGNAQTHRYGYIGSAYNNTAIKWAGNSVSVGDTTIAIPTSYTLDVRGTINATDWLTIPSDTAGLALDAAGTTTLTSDGTTATLSKPLRSAGYQAADGTAGVSQTIAITDKSDTTHTLVFKDGLLTSYSTAP